MKKSKRSLVFYGIVVILVSILFVNFLFHIFYFSNFHKNVRPVSDSERLAVMGILEEELNLNGYSVEILDVYTPRNKRLVQVDLVGNSSRKHYLVDLDKGMVRRK